MLANKLTNAKKLDKTSVLLIRSQEDSLPVLKRNYIRDKVSPAIRLEAAGELVQRDTTGFFN